MASCALEVVLRQQKSAAMRLLFRMNELIVMVLVSIAGSASFDDRWILRLSTLICLPGTIVAITTRAFSYGGDTLSVADEENRFA